MDFDYQQHQRQHQQQQQQQQQQPPQWPPHLLHSHSHPSAYPSPVSPPATLGDSNQNQNQYTPIYYQPNSQQGQQGQGQPLDRTPSSLSLSMNLAGLSVASPTNVSPINPSPLHTHQPLTLGQGGQGLNGGHPSQHHPGLSHSHSSSTVSSTVSPVTPISPGPHSHHPFGSHGGMQTFQFGMPDQRYEEHPFDMRQPVRNGGAVPSSSRSSSSGEIEKSVPRKRSFSANPRPGLALSTNIEESVGPASAGLGHGREIHTINTNAINVNMYTPTSFRSMQVDSAGGAYPSEDMDVVPSSSFLAASANGATNGSPVDGNGGGGISPIEGGGSGCVSEDGGGDGEGDDMGLEGEREDQLKPLEGMGGGGAGGMDAMGMGILGGKAPGTNNFVAKLYQMISDPSSSRFISWTELGTSFVVSNVGEFSRSILGSHFKHNNFSSFVRQLNMYGFHKINRTPRSQRTSTDAQTWEFSHHKFLRGRPDLLDEIKRKALETTPGTASDGSNGKHRVELPGEMMVMREENRRVWDALMAERRKVERLTSVVKGLWEVVGKGFPGSVPPFPADLLEGSDSPNIYITSPTSAGANPPRFPALTTSLSSQSLHSLHSATAGSPVSSPTTAEFAHHPHPHASTSAPSLSRQHSYQQMQSYPGPPGSRDAQSQSTAPGSPDEQFEGEERPGSKRQRTSKSNENLSVPMGMSAVDTENPGGVKRVSRARSDSAPLGYGLGGYSHSANAAAAGWQQGGTRPRSGSSLATGRGTGPASRPTTSSSGGSNTPLLSIPALSTNSPGR